LSTETNRRILFGKVRAALAAAAEGADMVKVTGIPITSTLILPSRTLAIHRGAKKPDHVRLSRSGENTTYVQRRVDGSDAQETHEAGWRGSSFVFHRRFCKANKNPHCC